MVHGLEFKVAKGSAGQRLDLFLALSAPEFSRSHIRKQLNIGKVEVNSKVEYRPNYKVTQGDVVVFAPDGDTQKKQLPELHLPVKILYKDTDIVIVDKPSGLKVHPTTASDCDSLLNAMSYNLRGELSGYGIELVNRIDKATSGIVVLAISAKGAWYYSKLFAEGKVEKEYLAVVDGMWLSHFGREEKRESGFLKFDYKQGRQVVSDENGEFAETKFRFIKLSPRGDKALLSVKPLTGRTHQIRVHLAAIGFPIIGDRKYGGMPSRRLLLHAYRLKLPLISGKRLVVEAEPSKDFRF